MFDPYISLAQKVIKAWQGGHRYVRAAVLVSSASILTAIIAALLSSAKVFPEQTGDLIAGAFGAVAAVLLLWVAAYQSVTERKLIEDKIEYVEERARENPDKPQLAWDLARTKLESYLDRNLNQVRSIYWLTLAVMLFGFALIVYGLLKAFDQPDKLSVSIVSAASGVVVSFIGGSFLLIYRSILAQSEEYVRVLERINAVGMAVQVIASIPEEHGQLKHQTTAELARQLLGIYAPAASTRAQSGVMAKHATARSRTRKVQD